MVGRRLVSLGIDMGIVMEYVGRMSSHRSTARKAAKPPPEGDRLVQCRIRHRAYDLLVQRATADTRSIANYLERMIYEHLGITDDHE